MKEISIADFQVLEMGSFILNETQKEKTVFFTIPEDIALNQVVVLQAKVTVKDNESTFSVTVGETAIWGMKVNQSHTRGLWQTFMAKHAFGEQKGKNVGITFTVPSGIIAFSDIIIWYQRTLSL